MKIKLVLICTALAIVFGLTLNASATARDIVASRINGVAGNGHGFQAVAPSGVLVSSSNRPFKVKDAHNADAPCDNYSTVELCDGSSTTVKHPPGRELKRTTERKDGSVKLYFSGSRSITVKPGIVNYND